jgi:hypothetical protein
MVEGGGPCETLGKYDLHGLMEGLAFDLDEDVVRLRARSLRRE